MVHYHTKIRTWQDVGMKEKKFFILLSSCKLQKEDENFSYERAFLCLLCVLMNEKATNDKELFEL